MSELDIRKAAENAARGIVAGAVHAEPRVVGHGHPPRPIGVWDLNPGDAVWPGTAGAGENLCPDCSGEGQYEGQTCHTCGGTGLVMVPVSGGT